MRATIAIAMTAKTPAHQWQQCHHNEADDASLKTSNEGNNASLTMAEMPLFDNSDNPIVTRATIAIMTTAKTPTHQWQ